MAKKNGFDITTLIFKTCVFGSVMQWSRSCLHLQMTRVRLPATVFIVFCCIVFLLLLFVFVVVVLFCLVFVFKSHFSFIFGLVFFILTADPAAVMHLDQYIF